MERELVHLQWVILAMIVALIVLSVLVTLAGWLVVNLSQLIERVRATLGRLAISHQPLAISPTPPTRELAVDDTVEYASLFRPLKPGDMVIVIEELNWSHGHGAVVPAGSRLKLVSGHTTTQGIRWSARWDGHYLSFIPPELLRLARPEEMSRVG